MAPVIGKLADLYGKKRVLLAILTVYVFGVLLTAVSPDYAMLTLSRSVQGIGPSINRLASTILRERLPDRELPVVRGVHRLDLRGRGSCSDTCRELHH